MPSYLMKSILKAESELNEGKGIPHVLVMKKYSRYFTS